VLQVLKIANRKLGGKFYKLIREEKWKLLKKCLNYESKATTKSFKNCQ